MAWINGSWVNYDPYGRATDTPMNAGTDAGGIGIGGAPQGTASWYDPARSARLRAEGAAMPAVRGSGMSNSAMGARAYAARLKKANDAWNSGALSYGPKTGHLADGTPISYVGEGPYNNRQDPNNGYGGWDPRSPAGQNWAAQQQNPAAAQAIGGVQNDPNYGGAPAPALDASQTTTGSGYGQNGVNMPSMDPWGGSGTGSSYTPPSPAAGSATATNPFLNLGLNAFTNTQQAWNPGYLNPLVSSLWNQAGQQWNDVINPSINNSAIVAGGYGGDRAAISKGVAADRLNQSVFNAVAPVYAQGYENWANRALQGGQAASSVGSGLEQLDLSRMLGIGELQNAGRALDISQQNANTSTAAQAANSAGVPTYTNPLSAGLGGALGIAQLLNMIFGKG